MKHHFGWVPPHVLSSFRVQHVFDWFAYVTAHVGLIVKQIFDHMEPNVHVIPPCFFHEIPSLLDGNDFVFFTVNDEERAGDVLYFLNVLKPVGDEVGGPVPRVAGHHVADAFEGRVKYKKSTFQVFVGPQADVKWRD